MKRLQNTRGETELNHFERTRMPERPSLASADPGSSHGSSLLDKKFVLYVKPNDRPSQIAYEIASKLFDIVHIQDTKRLNPREIPPFLRGVPTLLDVVKKEAYPGKLCIEHLENLISHFSLVSSSREIGGSVVCPDPFSSSTIDTLEPQGISAQNMDGYAACELSDSDPSVYQTGRRRKEDIDGVISKLMQERTVSEKPRGEPTASEMSKILKEMQEQ